MKGMPLKAKYTSTVVEKRVIYLCHKGSFIMQLLFKHV